MEVPMFAALFLITTITLQQGEARVLSSGDLGLHGNVEVAIFDGHLMPVFERSGNAYIILAADVSKPAGDYSLQVSSGRTISNFFVRVRKKDFRTVTEDVPYKPLTIPPKERAEKEAERQPMLSALKHGESGQIWQSLFCYPTLVSKISGEFGLRRVYTNHTSQHQGVDIVSEPFRIVRAISEARVLYAEDKELYLEGKTVILDHGQGIISIYLHLAEVRVKTGDRVAQGKEIGIVGSTGNSTGRHLHFAITVAGAHVDPLKFIDTLQDLE